MNNLYHFIFYYFFQFYDQRGDRQNDKIVFSKKQKSRNRRRRVSSTMFFAQIQSREEIWKDETTEKNDVSLVDDVGDGVTGVELDLGEDGFTAGWGRNNWGSDWGGNGSGGVSEGSGNGGTGVGQGSGDGGSSVGQGSGQGEGLSGGWDGEDLTTLALSWGWGGSLIESLLEFSLGGLDLLGVFNWGGSNEVEDGLLELNGLGDWEVGSGDAESEGISDVVHGLDDSVGIDVAGEKLRMF